MMHFSPSTVTYLASLPQTCEEILSVNAAAGVLDRGVPVSAQPTPFTPPLSIVLYVLCDNLLHTTNTAPWSRGAGPLALAALQGPPGQSEGESCLDCFKIMGIISELLESEEIPPFIRERIVIQVWYMLVFQNIKSLVFSLCLKRILNCQIRLPFFFFLSFFFFFFFF